jgi:hypothetical protein
VEEEEEEEEEDGGGEAEGEAAEVESSWDRNLEPDVMLTRRRERVNNRLVPLVVLVSFVWLL